jgi:hypothetical protein
VCARNNSLPPPPSHKKDLTTKKGSSRYFVIFLFFLFVGVAKKKQKKGGDVEEIQFCARGGSPVSGSAGVHVPRLVSREARLWNAPKRCVLGVCPVR